MNVSGTGKFCEPKPHGIIIPTRNTYYYCEIYAYAVSCYNLLPTVRTTIIHCIHAIKFGNMEVAEDSTG